MTGGKCLQVTDDLQEKVAPKSVTSVVIFKCERRNLTGEQWLVTVYLAIGKEI